MKRKLLATAAVLAVAIAVGPAYAQTNIASQSGVSSGSSQGMGQGGGSMHREQDQGIKVGQAGGGAGGTSGGATGGASGAGSAGGSTGEGSGGGEMKQHGPSGGAMQNREKSSATEKGGTTEKGGKSRATEKGEKSEKKAGQPSDRTKERAGERDHDRSTMSKDQEKSGKSARDQNERDRDKSATEKGRDSGSRMSKDSHEGGGKSVKIDHNQQSRVSVAIRNVRVQPETKLNFSIRVGVAVPRTIHFHTVPTEVVEIVPQYRGFLFFVADDQIVIVDPGTYEIVTVIPYSAASTGSRNRLSSNDRAVIRKRTATRTAPARVQRKVTREYEVGDVVPADVEVYDLPPTVYTEVPAVRSYRYIRTGDRMVLIDPRERRVVDVID